MILPKKMSHQTLEPAEIFQSKILQEPLCDDSIRTAIKILLKLLKTSIGPQGRLKLIGNEAGGHVTVTSSSSRLFYSLSIQNTFLKFIKASLNSHLSLYGDGGLQCALVTLELLNNSLNLSYPNPLISELNKHFAHIFINLLQSSENNCMISVDFSNLSHLLSIVQSIVSSKPGCILSDENKKHISLLLLKSFLNSISESFNIVSQNVNFCVLEGVCASESKLFNGFLVRCPEITNKKILLMYSGVKNFNETFKIALFATSLSGDAIFPSNNLEESGFSLWSEVLNHLKTLTERLICDGIQIMACQKVVHPVIRKLLEDNGVLVIDRLGLEQAQNLHLISGAIPVESISSACHTSYGSITSFDIVEVGKKKFFLLQNENRPFYTILICNYNEEAVLETKMVCRQAIDALYRLLKQPLVCFGAGCTEVHVLSLMEKVIKNQLSELSIEYNCSQSAVLQVLENFQLSITNVAIMLHQGTRLSFTTETVYGHLWKLNDGQFPSGNTTCMCDHYSAHNIDDVQWKLLAKDFTNTLVLREDKIIPNQVRKSTILDELSSKVNAYSVAFETSSLLLQVGLCILSGN